MINVDMVAVRTVPAYDSVIDLRSVHDETNLRVGNQSNVCTIVADLRILGLRIIGHPLHRHMITMGRHTYLMDFLGPSMVIVPVADSGISVGTLADPSCSPP
jgi:hypothetical protein